MRMDFLEFLACLQEASRTFQPRVCSEGIRLGNDPLNLHCPITAVVEMKTGKIWIPFQAACAAEDALGMDQDLASTIMLAADFELLPSERLQYEQRHIGWVRETLEAACGLPQG